MASHKVDILESLGLTSQSAELERRLTAIEYTVQVQRQLRSTLTRLQVPRQGFTDWRFSLRKFDGDTKQTRQAQQQGEEALVLLAKIDKNICNLEEELMSADCAQIDSNELLADVVELDVAVRDLIRLFPGARRAGLFSIDQSGPTSSCARAQPPTRDRRRPLPPLTPTEEAPLEEVGDTVPVLQPRQSTLASSPSPRRTSSGNGHVYRHVTSDNQAQAVLGTFYAASVLAHSGPLPQIPANEYNDILAKGNSKMLMGDAVGGSPFVETAEPRNTTPTQGLIRRFTDKMKRKESVR